MLKEIFDSLGKREIFIIALVLCMISACLSSVATRDLVYKDVIQAESERNTAVGQLDNVTTHLNNATDSLIDMYYNLDNKTNIIIALGSQLVAKGERITNLTEELGDTTVLLVLTQQWLKENTTLVEQLQNGTEETYNVSEVDIHNFMLFDLVSSNVYNATTYNCFDFSTDTRDNAIAQGIESCIVFLYFENSTVNHHVLVGFNTTDNGTVYYEPQTDELVTGLTVGKQYWTECVNGNYTDVSNDTIRKIIKIW